MVGGQEESTADSMTLQQLCMAHVPSPDMRQALFTVPTLQATFSQVCVGRVLFGFN
jgi:hypothetical protein